MKPTLSIVIPTMGRDTLTRTLESIEPQLRRGDQLVLACDGYAALETASRTWARYAAWGKTELLNIPTREEFAANPGGTQRNRVLEGPWAKGNYLLWCGDDDIYLPGALDAVRAHAAAAPGRPLMFRMITPCGAHPWQEEDRGRIERHYVGDHMFVAPNVPAMLGRFGPTYSGDYDFIRSTLDLYLPLVAEIWCPETLVHCRPEGK